MRLSVIIPTRDRYEILRSTLAAMENQTLQKHEFEVIVVDTSTEQYHRKKVREHQGQKATLRTLELDTGSVAAARNFGADNAEGGYLLFLNDDIVPALDTLKQHLEAHTGSQERIAVVGKIRFADQVPKSCFVHYLESSCYYDAYSQVRYNPNILPPIHGNSSLSKELFNEIGQYDADLFTGYGAEAEELGLRLTKAGIRVVYADGAIGYHAVAKTFEEVTQDMVEAGAEVIKLFRKHPEIKSLKDVDAMVDPNEELSREKRKVRAAFTAKPDAMGMRFANYFIKKARNWKFFAGLLMKSFDKVLKAHYGRGMDEGLAKQVK
jgi:GT2 family glycosyltransferase